MRLRNKFIRKLYSFNLVNKAVFHGEDLTLLGVKRILNRMNSAVSHPKISVRSRLISLVLVSIIPVLIFAGVLASYLTYRQNENVEQSLRGTARALTVASDRQIHTVIATLQVLLELEDFAQGDQYLQSLHRRLQRVVKSQMDWIALAYTDTDGSQYFNTSRPFGEKLPSLKGQPFFEKALKSGKVVISDFRQGLVTKTKIISIAIPVYENKIMKSVLVASIETASLSRTLATQNLAGGRVAAILDRNSVIIARSKNAESLIGKPATEKLSKESRKKSEGIFRDVNQEGMDSYGAFYRSKLTDWTIVVGLPSEEFTKETRETFLIIVVAAVFFVGLGTYLAFLVGSRISKPILALSDQANALGSGHPIQDIQTNLLEVSEVSEALKKAASDRDLSDKKARDAVELRDNFLSIASHELKTPITALQLNLQIIQKNIVEERLAKPMERALRQITRLTTLVDELLDVSRLTSGKLNFHLEEVNLNELLSEMILPYTENHVTLAASKTIVGIWDRGRLEQVITNLLSNAIKYGEAKPIQVSLSEAHGKVFISIIDNGMGIKQEDLGRIFERFERAVQHNSISGLGLGLWITHHIVTGMNGSIIVESEVGSGATFTVTLPLQQKEV
jgi:signal transduction histidine kinase